MEFFKQTSYSRLSQIELDVIHQNLEEITNLVKRINEENQKINQLVDKIIKFRDQVLQYNKDLVRSLQIFKVISEKSQKETFEKQLSNFKISNLSNIQKTIQKEIMKVTNKISALKDSQFYSFKQFSDSINFKPDNLLSKKPVNNPLLEIDLIKNYKTLCKNINLCMDLHSNSTKLIDRNYKIKNAKQIERLIEIMKEEV